MTDLTLSENPIYGSAEAALAGVLRDNRSITTLRMDCNAIGGGIAAAIASALQTNSVITTLKLSQHDELGDEGAAAIAEALKINTSITQLSLMGLTIGGAGDVANAGRLMASLLTTLARDACDLGDEVDAATGLSGLLRAIPHCLGKGKAAMTAIVKSIGRNCARAEAWRRRKAIVLARCAIKEAGTRLLGLRKMASAAD